MRRCFEYTNIVLVPSNIDSVCGWLDVGIAKNVEEVDGPTVDVDLRDFQHGVTI